MKRGNSNPVFVRCGDDVPEGNRALLELPLEQRSTVLLHLERSMTLAQIAEVCGCGRETVKSRLRYATARLRKALGDLYDEL